MAILQDLTAPSYEELKAKVARYEAREAARHKVTFKVSEKGACSVYGLGRFPVTLYKSQWVRLFAHQQELNHFLANASDLAEKGE